MSQSRSLFVWLCLVVVAVNLICLFVLIPAVSTHFNRTYTLNHYDGDGYDQIAQNLVDGNGYRLYPETAKTLMREPGYPILLAGLYKTFGRSLWLVQSLNLILALATAYLIMRMAGGLSSSRIVIFGSPLLFLFHPETLLAESRGGVEILFGLLLTLYLLSVYKAIKNARWQDYLLSGGVLGLACLVRSTPILFPIFLLGYLFLFRPVNISRPVIFRNIAVMVLAMFVVLSPWIVRNYLLTKKFVPTASVLGVSAQAGLYLSSRNAVGNRDIDTEASWQRNIIAGELGYHFKAGYLPYFYSSADEVAFSNYLFRSVLHTYERSPLLLLRTVVSNGLFNFWCAGKTRASVAMNAIVQFPLLGLAILGLILSMRDGRVRDIAPMALVVAYIVAVSMPILAQARYSAPLIPFLSIFACTGLAMLLRNLSRAWQKPRQIGPNLDESGAEIEAQQEPRAEVQLSIVIPAYNEQARLPRTALESIHWCTDRKLDFELLIVDDGSQDETLALARLLEERDVRVRALARSHFGKGAAVRAGALCAKGRFILFMDADGATPLDEIPKLLAAMEQGYDVAIGSRAARGPGEVEVRTSLLRRFIGRSFALFVSLLAFDGIADTQCGFKMFRRDAAKAIFSRQKIVGFAFDVEVLFIARRLSFSVVEIPVNWVAQPGSKVSLVADSMRMLRDISQIRWMHRGLSSLLRVNQGQPRCGVPVLGSGSALGSLTHSAQTDAPGGSTRPEVAIPGGGGE